MRSTSVANEMLSTVLIDFVFHAALMQHVLGCVATVHSDSSRYRCGRHRIQSSRCVTMKTHLSHISLFTLVLLVSFSLAAFAQDKTPPQAYSGVAIGTGGSVGGKTILFDFRITQFTTDEELQNFAQLVKEKGTDALRRALEKEDKGRINAVGSTGNQIAVARKRELGSETIITIVTARTMPFVELYRNGRTTDYPFGYLQVKLDATGKGTGQIMAAARIRFDKKKGQYEIESFGNQYIKATNVRPQ
jgi:hypothetical protein